MGQCTRTISGEGTSRAEFNFTPPYFTLFAYSVIMVNMGKRCNHCGAELNRHPNAKYCQACAEVVHREQTKAYRKRVLESGICRCKVCGKPLLWNGSYKKKKPEQCIDCYRKHMRKGKDSPTWKGGKFTSYGYVYVYCPEPNPRRRKQNKHGEYYIAEHILKWEKANKMPLPANHIVHHINGIRHDNRPQNLLALPRGSHSGYEVQKALQKRIRELESILEQKALNL